MFPAIISGWSYDKEEYKRAHKNDGLVKLVTELSNVCNLSCDGCFTKKIVGTWNETTKKRLPDEMGYDVQNSLIDEAVALGVKTIDFVGAGEPTLDRGFQYTSSYCLDRGLNTVIFTHGATSQLTNFAGESRSQIINFFIKLWSFDSELQDKYVKGAINNYSKRRDEALEKLISLGYNNGVDKIVDGIKYKTTRLGADILVMKSNYNEIPNIFRYCRKNNIMPEIKTYIPEGPTRFSHEQSSSIYSPSHLAELRKDEISPEKFLELRKRLVNIDETEFGIQQMQTMYPQSCKCTQSMASLYVTIQGDVRSCVGSHLSYGKYEPGKEMLREVLMKRKNMERVGFGCIPRLEDAKTRKLEISDELKKIYRG